VSDDAIDERSTLRRRVEEAEWWYAIGKQVLNANWQLRKAASVGKGPVVLGRPRIDATDLVVGDRFSVWSVHRQTLITGGAGSGSATGASSTAGRSSLARAR